MKRKAAEAQSRKDLCLNCRTRPAGASKWAQGDPWEFFCTVCKAAHGLVFTSIDDARQSINAVTEPQVLEMALRMERKRGVSRRVFVRLCGARLNRLEADRASAVDRAQS